MSHRPGRRRIDLFTLLLIVLAVGMSVTLAYQLSVYHAGDAPPIAEGRVSAPAPGG